MRIFIVLFMVICMASFLFFPIEGQAIGDNKEPVPSTDHYILLEQTTGRVLLENNAHDRMSVASITKLMTAVVALEYGNLKDTVEVSEEAVQTNGSSIYLEVGEELTLEDLLYGLMLRSGNDAAKVIAEHIGGSEEGFVYLMNETAAYIGMTDSQFKNPHGLDEKGHYSSAYDIAILMQYAMQNETFQKISSTTSYHSEKRTYPWRNKNRLLTEKYEYATGGKTGFTNQAGRTLVSTAEKDQLQYIAVTLDAPDDWNDHISLYDWGFSSFDLVKLEKAGERNFITEESVYAGIVPYDVVFPLHEEEQEKIKKTVQLYKSNDKDKVGLMTFIVDNQEVIEVPIFETSNAKQPGKQSWLNRWRKIIKGDRHD